MLFGRFYPPSHIDSCTIPPAVRLAESPSSLPRHPPPRPSVAAARAAGAFDRLRRPRWLSLSKPPLYVVLLKSHPSGVSTTKSTLTEMRRGAEVTRRLAIFAVKKLRRLEREETRTVRIRIELL
jgi:hypothetical protein